jgi:hypothetical protein
VDFSHGGNTGSSPVGSAKDFKHLVELRLAGSKTGPIYGCGRPQMSTTRGAGSRVSLSAKWAERPMSQESGLPIMDAARREAVAAACRLASPQFRIAGW